MMISLLKRIMNYDLFQRPIHGQLPPGLLVVGCMVVGTSTIPGATSCDQQTNNPWVE